VNVGLMGLGRMGRGMALRAISLRYQLRIVSGFGTEAICSNAPRPNCSAQQHLSSVGGQRERCLGRYLRIRVAEMALSQLQIADAFEYHVALGFTRKNEGNPVASELITTH
jgi:hypothetical protein